MFDVLVIGAGITGCASARSLAERGVTVGVLERGPCDGASWAAAGVLGAQLEASEDGPLARLCLAGRDSYARLVEVLREATGIDVGYRRSGALRVGLTPDDAAAIARGTRWQAEAGLAVEALDGAAARALEPALGGEVAGGVLLADEARIDPPTLMRALRIATERAGARFLTGAARRVLVQGGRARGVALEGGGEVLAGRVVLAAGSWSSLIEGAGLAADAVRPARGQIVELLPSSPVLRRVVFGPSCYLSPRDEGRVLVGATTEFVGYAPGVTARAVRDLLTAALRLVPALEEAALGRTWSGLRPHTRDELPYLGEGEIRDLIVATGHFRNGILLGPITGEIVAALAVGAAPPVDIAPFSLARGGAARAE